MIGLDGASVGGYSRSGGGAALRSQFVLDAETDRLLSQLAATRAGNRSLVVREAIRLYADLEVLLDKVEASPGLQRMMERSARDIEAGRIYTSRQLRRQLSARRGKQGSV
jgi:predicted transcriptional regulator